MTALPGMASKSEIAVVLTIEILADGSAKPHPVQTSAVSLTVNPHLPHFMVAFLG